MEAGSDRRNTVSRRNWMLPGILVLIIGFIGLRVVCSYLLKDQIALFAQPEVKAWLLQDQPEPTLPPPVTTQPPETTPVTAPTVPIEPPQSSYRLRASDATLLELNDTAGRQPDAEALLTQPLQWDLTQDGPSVLILHSHGTEAFVPAAGYTYQEEGGEYRTTDQSCNMLSLGQELARLLNEVGIQTVQDRSYYDYPDYPASYDNARTGLKEQLKKYPTVQLVIDLHRDSATRSDGSQWSTEAVINGEKSAQVMLVLGTDSHYPHPDWEQNLSLALKLQAVMEKTHPGSTRPLDLRKQRFNQDLSTGAIIAEIGAAGNTHTEAMNAVSVLAEAIILLSKGAN